MRGRAAALALFLTFSACQWAHARAGGGQNYSGGGFSSSGGGFSSGGDFSSGGGDNLLFAALRAWALWYETEPVSCVSITVLAVVLLVWNARSEGARLSRYEIPAALDAQDESKRRDALSRLTARDPGFDLDAFLGRAKAAFLKVQKAWSGQDMRPARPFVSDGVFERFSIQLELQKLDRFRNSMDQVSVLDASLLRLESDADFDAAHVAVRAQAVDTDVSLDDGRVVRLGELAPFEEVWTFLRRPGARSLKKPGLMEGFCPGCGASLEVADAAQCPSCRIWVQSGEYDWVLCEITQACEWGVREAREAPGWGALAKADPDINPQFLEDRASVAFWRWQEAMFRGEASAVRYRNVGVGRVTVAAAELGPPVDRVHVAVKWSGDLFEGGNKRGNAVRTDVLVLERKTGAKTTPASGLRSAACPGCGAPASSRDQEKCEFCGTAFNDGSRCWIVASVVPSSLWKPPEGKGDWSSPLSPHDALAVLVWGMLADGRVDDREREFLEGFAAKNGIPDDEVR